MCLAASDLFSVTPFICQIFRETISSPHILETPFSNQTTFQLGNVSFIAIMIFCFVADTDINSGLFLDIFISFSNPIILLHILGKIASLEPRVINIKYLLFRNLIRPKNKIRTLLKEVKKHEFIDGYQPRIISVTPAMLEGSDFCFVPCQVRLCWK